MNWFRRALLETWAMMILSGIVAFLGPFGSYLSGDFLTRDWRWTQMLFDGVLFRLAVVLCPRAP